MRENYTNELNELNTSLIDMGNLIEDAIKNTEKIIGTGDVEAGKNIIKNDDTIDQKEKEIESLCLKLILKQQPVASDLRFITSALKMVTDMERIGDHASDIAELVIQMKTNKYKEVDNIRKMSAQVIKMIHESVDAYITRDYSKAQDVIASDDIVDELFHVVKRDLINQIRSADSDGEEIADVLMIAKYYERIGDHATNIAEWVIFSLTGKLS